MYDVCRGANETFLAGDLEETTFKLPYKGINASLNCILWLLKNIESREKYQ